MKTVGIVWFRNDLRLNDNLALSAATRDCDIVIPIYTLCDKKMPWAEGAATRWWLHQSLKQLSADLHKRGSELLLLKGDPAKLIQELTKQIECTSLYLNRRYDPFGRQQEQAIRKVLEKDGISVESFNSNLLHEPDMVHTKSGGPFKVFTPFWNHCAAQIRVDELEPTPSKLKPATKLKGLPLSELGLEPEIDWAAGIRAEWTPGEHGAQQQLEVFIDESLEYYQPGRDIPSTDQVSKLSPHLHFGEIGPRQIWLAINKACAGVSKNSKLRTSADIYLKEIGWREFAHHVLYHFPDTADSPLQPKFNQFPWRNDAEQLKAWQKGLTGYPIVDAGMRQLWHTGWMHNRVRMIVASFLTKHLLLSWKEGARWFWDTLVDADLANNTLGWQWASGCGADAAPYFRIFNPELQGEKFDPDGIYVKRWCPELSKVPSKWVHKPWKAPLDVLSASGVELGKNYPNPLVDHSFARVRALGALESIKGI